ncbi:hypothetical protein B0T22DRAFT_480229 [Podospora appendiculata]|uniref:Uncharacterized protein n=1 Tax=Podospora appendiculata TaxID=314037 RepID=A0AAE1CCX9_9PEZI|nr:hypothetical protein B0T22DRAFT_480229 [Podospora appendiculata]
MDSTIWNCSQDIELALDADITGTGVLIGFLGTAWMAISFVLAFYIIGFDPTLDPFQEAGSPRETLLRPNPVDMIL